ncbi:rCG46648 [Rattus norvegicus]|uniref:RCG46648 n=1 Tax=Rattus norvegicus TaxID=10116 RepID=A6IXX0_RAT|nr:rCG46648 [Rattus norvegicus]
MCVLFPWRGRGRFSQTHSTYSVPLLTSNQQVCIRPK